MKKMRFDKERQIGIACSQYKCKHYKSIIGAEQNCGGMRNMESAVESCEDYYPEQFIVKVKI